MTKNVKVGIILILAGVVMLLSHFGLIPGISFLFMLGFGFIATYIIVGGRKEYGYVGFLIPGSILLAVATFAALGENTGVAELNPGFFFLGLSLSFLVVFLVHTYWFKELGHGDRYWPLYPAAGLLVFAGLIGVGTSGRWLEYYSLLNYLWIVALIAVGVWLIIKSILSQRT